MAEVDGFVPEDAKETEGGKGLGDAAAAAVTTQTILPALPHPCGPAIGPGPIHVRGVDDDGHAW